MIKTIITLVLFIFYTTCDSVTVEFIVLCYTVKYIDIRPIACWRVALLKIDEKYAFIVLLGRSLYCIKARHSNQGFSYNLILSVPFNLFSHVLMPSGILFFGTSISYAWSLFITWMSFNSMSKYSFFLIT